MSIVAKLAGWVAVFVFVGQWAWSHGPFNGANLLALVVLAVLIWGGFKALRGIDTSRVDRLADPSPLPYERGRQ